MFTKAVVVFEDNTTLWWLRLLPRGFRHCYVVLFADSLPFCVELNPMSNQVFINIYEKKSFYSQIKNKDFIIVDVAKPLLKAMPVSCFTCVEFVKRIIGLRSFFVITPKNLYTALKGCRK